jgi:hypothetical protein
MDIIGTRVMLRIRVGTHTVPLLGEITHINVLVATTLSTKRGWKFTTLMVIEGTTN